MSCMLTGVHAVIRFGNFIHPTLTMGGKKITARYVSNNTAMHTSHQWHKRLHYPLVFSSLLTNCKPDDVWESWVEAGHTVYPMKHAHGLILLCFVVVLLIVCWPIKFDGLVQDCSNSSALALELLQSCTKQELVINETVLHLFTHRLPAAPLHTSTPCCTSSHIDSLLHSCTCYVYIDSTDDIIIDCIMHCGTLQLLCGLWKVISNSVDIDFFMVIFMVWLAV